MHAFESHTWQHLLPIVLFTCLGVVLVAIGRRNEGPVQQGVGIVFAAVILIFLIGGSLIKINQGVFDLKEDLPLYLCRIIAWMLPVVIWKKSRFWLGIFYFWTLAGTLQGIVTPDLAEGFPAFLYLRYWFLHAGLVVAILYTTIVFKIRIKWKDFWRAVAGAQIYLVLVHLINILLGSNYSYTMHKPHGPSLLDLFGSWPWYILGGELLMVVLFLLLMLPWINWRHLAKRI